MPALQHRNRGLMCSPSKWLPGYFCPDKNIFVSGRTIFVKVISAPVKCFDLPRLLCMNTRHEPDHFTPGHLGVNAFLDNVAVIKLTKNAGNIAVFRLKILLDALCIFLRRAYSRSSPVTSSSLHKSRKGIYWDDWHRKKRKTIQKIIFCVLVIKLFPKPDHSTGNQINASSGIRSQDSTADCDP